MTKTEPDSKVSINNALSKYTLSKQVEEIKAAKNVPEETKHTPQKPEEVVWQQYHSARVSTRTITDTGKRILFTKHEYFTREADVVAWLDGQIDQNGLPGITRGKAMTTAERDPMEQLRQKHRAELRAEIKAETIAEAKRETRDMGTTKAAGAASINPASTKQIAN